MKEILHKLIKTIREARVANQSYEYSSKNYSQDNTEEFLSVVENSLTEMAFEEFAKNDANAHPLVAALISIRDAMSEGKTFSEATEGKSILDHIKPEAPAKEYKPKHGGRPDPNENPWVKNVKVKITEHDYPVKLRRYYRDHMTTEKRTVMLCSHVFLYIDFERGIAVDMMHDKKYDMFNEEDNPFSDHDLALAQFDSMDALLDYMAKWRQEIYSKD